MGLKGWLGRKLFLRWLRGQVKEWEMSKVWKFFDGWKLLIGAVAYAGVLVRDQMTNGHSADFVGAVLKVLGIDVASMGVEWGPLAAALVVVVGGAHKVIKANAQRKAGVPRAELLSSDGYVRAAHRLRR